jgi:Aldo/keto reductase family
MSMSGYYLDPDSSDAEAIRTIHRALDLGVSHIDTAEIYGPYTNEDLVGRAITARRDEVVLATKFGFVSHFGGGPGVLDSRPANIRTAVEGSLERLDTDHIDLYYQHRVDPNTPIEDTVGALAELVAEGKIRHIGLSEASPERPAAPTPSTRSPRCRPSTHCGPGIPRPSCCRSCASWASASSPTRRSATASSPGTSARPRSSPTTTGARPTRASPARTSSATCASSTKSRPSPPRRTPRRHRGPWPGSSLRATTSPRSPAPSASPASRRTPPPTRSS